MHVPEAGRIIARPESTGYEIVRWRDLRFEVDLMLKWNLEFSADGILWDELELMGLERL